MTHQIAIRLRGISKRWGGQQVVEGLDLDIGRGQLVALLGPSGCGKSTTLRLIAGLEHADAGSVEINGCDVSGAAPSARALSMVFQSYALFPHLGVADNIRFGMQVRRVAPAEQARRLHQAMELTNLQGLERRKPSELSGGQRQRVALARAIVSGHSICLMDEPLSNLDARLRHTVRQEIRTLQQRLGMTVLYVTHDQTEAMGMADQIVLMHAGRIEQSGTPAALYEQPASAFSAAFIGSPPMLLLPAARLAPLLRPEMRAHLPGHACRVGIRPERLRLAAAGHGHLRGSVTGLEFQGAESFIYVGLPGGDQLIVRTPDKPDVRPGMEISLSWQPEDMYFFDHATGRRC